MAIAQFAFMNLDGAPPAAYAAGATVETETISGANAATTAASEGGQNACRVAVDTASYVSFGAAPNAGTDTVRFFLPAGSIEYFRIGVGLKAAVIAA
jgi:hypothetical protein